MIVFMISGAMAGLGGVIFASRLNSVDLNAGGGTILLDAIAAAVIGGTSLFGGRGEVISALLGALVIATLANGIDLARLRARRSSTWSPARSCSPPSRSTRCCAAGSNGPAAET